jgi:hypothetical protein
MSEDVKPATEKADAANEHDWSTHAPPEMTPESIAALRSVVADDMLVEVEWYDPRTVSHAPWDFYCRPEDMKLGVCLSFGVADDLPDEMAILVRPHFVPNPFGDDEDWNEGEIVIPYRSIRFIYQLTASRQAFSCYKSGRSTPIVPRKTEKTIPTEPPSVTR